MMHDRRALQLLDRPAHGDHAGEDRPAVHGGQERQAAPEQAVVRARDAEDRECRQGGVVDDCELVSMRHERRGRGGGKGEEGIERQGGYVASCSGFCFVGCTQPFSVYTPPSSHLHLHLHHSHTLPSYSPLKLLPTRPHPSSPNTPCTLPRTAL
jgi:hypothetical protein